MSGESPLPGLAGRSVHGHQHEETLSSSEDLAEVLKDLPANAHPTAYQVST